MDDENLTVEQALAMIAPGEDVHTFVNPADNVLVGCDWPRAEIESLVHTTEARRRAGEYAREMKHGLALLVPKNYNGFPGPELWLFVETAETLN